MSQTPSSHFPRKIELRPTFNALPFADIREGTFVWTAIASRGVEEVAAAELRKLGASHVRAGRSGVSFEADFQTAYRAHLQIRTISRILYPVREFAAAHARMLYDQIYRLPWENVIHPAHTIAVDCTAGMRPENSPLQDDSLTHTHFAALKIKDAIVDRIRDKKGVRPNVNTENPMIRVFAHLGFKNGARCSISLDATGASLHERGYRPHGVLAPLKETLAAAIVDLSGWTPEETLVDPLCGSGTLLIEAARKHLGIANISRPGRYCFMNWPNFDIRTWDAAIAASESKPTFQAKLFGFDSSQKALGTARQSARSAGVIDQIEWKAQELKNLVPPPGRPGIVMTNPPYGERVGDVEQLKDLYYLFGKIMRERFAGWKLCLLSGNPELTPHLEMKATKKDPLFNGKIECRLLHYEIRERKVSDGPGLTQMAPALGPEAKQQSPE